MNTMASAIYLKYALVLEDIPEVNTWMRQMLQETFPALQVKQAYSLKDSYELLRNEHQYDIALIDLALPDGKGTQIIEYLTRNSPKTLVLVVSIFEDDEHLFKAIQSGAHGYLLKDAEPEDFKTALRQIAQGEYILSPLFMQKMFAYVRRHEKIIEQDKSYQNLPLTCREREVLVCIAAGMQVSETAQQLSISGHTVASYVKEIYRKLDISTRAEAALIAVRHGLL